MEFFDVIEKRRSIRSFENRPVEAEKIDRLMETILRAPNARGAHSCSFVVVDDKPLLEKLTKARPSGGAFVAKAPLAVVVCADPGKVLPWVEDAAIAASHLQLAAQALGLGSCWFHIRGKDHNDTKSSHQYVADLLQLPDNVQVVCIIAVGYPAEEKSAYSVADLPFDLVRYHRKQ